MFCTNCGKTVDENDRFCQYCGVEVNVRAYHSGNPGDDAKYGEESPGNGNPAINPEYVSGFSQGTEYSNESDSEQYGFGGGPAGDRPQGGYSGYSRETFDVAAAVRNLGSSPLFFAGIILAAVNAVFSFISALSGVTQYSVIFGADSATSISAGVSVGGAVGLIMAAVSIIGMIMFYAANKNSESAEIKTTGLSVVRIMAIIECVLMFVLSAVLLIAGIFIIRIVSIYSNGFGEDMVLGIGLIFFIIIIAAAAIVFLDIFYVKLVKTIKSILETARTGIVTGNISLYVIVLLFIIAFANLVLQLSGTAISAICGLAGAATNVLFALILIKYRQMYGRARSGLPL